MAQLLINPFNYSLDNNGEVIAGGKLYFYEAGTTTPLGIFSDKDLTTPLSNPVVSDGNGIFPTIWLQSDIYKIVYTDASDVTIKTSDNLDFSNSATFDSIKQSATTTYEGVVELATNAETITGTDITKSVTPSGVAAAIENQGLPKAYITGLVINLDTDTDHDINITSGKARDNDDSFSINLISEITKQIDANWAEGDDAGGFPSGLTLSADTWYHVFIIAKSDGTVDAGFDTSLTATNLLADATGYTKYRRIGSVLTDGSDNIVGFTAYQIAGGGVEITYKTSFLDLDISSLSLTRASINLSVPPLTKAKINTSYVDNDATAGYILITEEGQDDVVPSITNSTFSATVSSGAFIQTEFKTNSSGQIYYRADDTTAAVAGFKINTLGYIDERI